MEAQTGARVELRTRAERQYFLVHFLVPFLRVDRITTTKETTTKKVETVQIERAKKQDGGTSTPFQQIDQAIFPSTTQPNIPQNKPVRSYPPSTLQRHHPDDMPPSPNRSHKLLQALQDAFHVIRTTTKDQMEAQTGARVELRTRAERQYFLVHFLVPFLVQPAVCITNNEMKSQEGTSVKPGGDCENDSSQTEPIEKRWAKGGRKKGETKSINKLAKPLGGFTTDELSPPNIFSSQDEAMTVTNGTLAPPDGNSADVLGPEYHQKVRLATLSAMIAVSIIGNTGMAYHIRQKWAKRTRVHLLFVHLGAADILVTLFAMTSQLVWECMDRVWIAGDAFCRLFKVAQTFTLVASNYLLIAIAMDRHTAIVYPLSRGGIPATRTLILAAWIASLLPSLPSAYIFQEVRGPSGQAFCVAKFYTHSLSRLHRQIYMAFIFLAVFILPILLILGLYTRILYVIWTRSQQKAGSGATLDTAMTLGQGRVPRARVKTLKMTLTVVATFLATSLPYLIQEMIIAFGDPGLLDQNIVAMSGIFSASNSAINPYIYLLFNSKAQLAKKLTNALSSPFSSNNKKFRNDIVTERLSRQDKDIMELNQDSISVKSDGPTETTEERQEVRETGETTAPLADAVTQLSALLTRAKISDGAEATIPPFDGTYSAIQFFQAFDRKMEDASMGEQEKFLRLPNYLVRQPLELFRKLRMADQSYFQVRQILLDLYPESSEASLAKYFAMKLTGQANLETYYREKTAMGLQLGLPQEVILETLTEGLPFNDQRLVRVMPPENLGEWFRLVQRIHGPSVHGMHLSRRPTASSAARGTGTANADIDQSRRPTKKCGRCKQSQNHQSRFHNNQVKPETPQPSRLFETEVGSLTQLTVKLFLAPNIPCPFLIDTGASLNIVPYNLYHMLKTHLPNLNLKGHSLNLQTLNGFAKTMGKLSIPLTIGQISRRENFHVVNAPLPFVILSINSLHKFKLAIDFNKCTIFQLGAPLPTPSYHFNNVPNVCTYWQCQAMSQRSYHTAKSSAYDNHCVHSLKNTPLPTCLFFTKANCLFYMPSNNKATTALTCKKPAQNMSIQQDNSHTKHIGDHTSSHNYHMTKPHNELDTPIDTQQNPLPHAYYNTTSNTHYTPQFTTLLQRYTHIFTQNKFNVPCLRIPPVKIPTNSDKIITIRPYRVPICDQQEIRNQVQQMLENGIIEQSFSPFSSPVTLVTKRDKTKRFCIDYRKVNELISSDVHPLPRIEDILDRLAQAKYFSTADISSAYWQVPIHPDSRPLLAFATLEGLYQPTRLPFGLKTSPQIYERAISQVLQRHGLDCVAHYFDDFIIYSNTLEEHQNHLRQFFAFCEAEKLQLNFVKCEFFKQSIDFLGYNITAGTITPLTRNTDIIHAIKQPHNRKTLQSFLGAVNNEVCQKAFIDLKGNLTQHPILHLYKEGLPCQVYCDASTLGIAGILKQVHPDGNVYPVQYFSRTLRPHEKNYSISELECLAIVESVEKFRIYLMGRKFTIFSDHHALQWLKTIKNPSGRLFRWSLRLSSYEYEVRYIKGKLQYEADLLSRNPFCGFLDATLIKTHQPPPSKESSLTIDRNGLHTVSRKGVTKIIIPRPLIQQLLQTVHTQYNHPGISQMSRLISTQYYWQGMSKDIKQKVKTCQLTKRPLGPTYGELSQPPEAKEPFDLLSLDTIAGFAKYGNTKIYLHVVVDHFSRYAWTFPSKSTSIITYQQVLKRVLQDGSPKRLLTDRAPAFTSPKFRSFLLNRNIHPLLTTSNNPQANGLCERLNATLTGKLRLLHLENPKIAWTKLVKRVTIIYNKTPHSTTGFPPIYLMFGILTPELSDHSTPYPDIDKARKIAHTRTQNKHLQDKNIYDQRHKQPHFEVGDLVLVKLYHHPNTGKLAPYFTGPHTVLEIISPNVVRIDRPNQPLQRDNDTIHFLGMMTDAEEPGLQIQEHKANTSVREGVDNSSISRSTTVAESTSPKLI
ncbi:hypothetical protein LAZ67_9000466 [Cordylochernes scorpioides]|uniref:RNA-directed DNA polymerase n=1 Tax=Cordylochernes scorpioides TaxID=51811 RepID=A0ABY6KSH7_9ARAC|nr:hypothetical protein LAZ67_9000466 [Cordylochernes scorpioides]